MGGMKLSPIPTRVSLLVPALVAVADTPPIDFARQIQPILAEKCILCHGPDEGTREADLRHDLHATLLHLLCFDHRKLTFRSQSRDFRLTDVHGDLIQGILA